MAYLNPNAKLFFIGHPDVDDGAVYAAKRKGLLRPIAPKVFLRTDLSAQEQAEVVMRNAVRIAMYNYPERVYLAGSSALHRGPVAGTLLLSAPWSRSPMSIGGFFNVHFTRSDIEPGVNGEVEAVHVEDDFGELIVNRIGDVLLLLKDARPNAALPESSFLTMADRAFLVERHIRRLDGDPARLHAQIDALARLHGLTQWAPKVKQSLGSFAYSDVPSPLKSFQIYWHEAPLANLSHDGGAWTFEYERDATVPFTSPQKGKRMPVPSFIGSILPEVGARIEDCMDDNLHHLDRWSRYLSNITILPKQLGAGVAPSVDVLQARLSKFLAKAGDFTGQLAGGLERVAANEMLIDSLIDNDDLPRISGQQVKLAAYLAKNGDLLPAVDRPFTHILKVPPPVGDGSSIGSNEWFCLALAKACRVETEDFALVDMGEGPPALLVERFDVRKSKLDKRMILSEDFWSVFGLRENHLKYKGELLDVADRLMSLSTQKVDDGRNLFMQAVFSWLTLNGDMHLKNLSVLREAKVAGSPITSVRLSPAYDMLCTKVYPQTHLQAAITLNGSAIHSVDGFLALAKRVGMSESEAIARMGYLTVAIRMTAASIAEGAPDALKRHELSVKHLQDARVMFEVRCDEMATQLALREEQTHQVSVVVPAADEDLEERVPVAISGGSEPPVRRPRP